MLWEWRGVPRSGWCRGNDLYLSMYREDGRIISIWENLDGLDYDGCDWSLVLLPFGVGVGKFH